MQTQKRESLRAQRSRDTIRRAGQHSIRTGHLQRSLWWWRFVEKFYFQSQDMWEMHLFGLSPVGNQAFKCRWKGTLAEAKQRQACRRSNADSTYPCVIRNGNSASDICSDEGRLFSSDCLIAATKGFLCFKDMHFVSFCDFFVQNHQLLSNLTKRRAEEPPMFLLIDSGAMCSGFHSELDFNFAIMDVKF